MVKYNIIFLFRQFMKPLTLIKVGFLKVVFHGGRQFDPLFIFQEELTQYQYNFIYIIVKQPI